MADHPHSFDAGCTPGCPAWHDYVLDEAREWQKPVAERWHQMTLERLLIALVDLIDDAEIARDHYKQGVEATQGLASDV